MSDALPLPPRPNLDQYRKLARDLQQACKSGEANAVRAWAGAALALFAFGVWRLLASAGNDGMIKVWDGAPAPDDRMTR